nr:phosphatase PAP2 family protein [Desulfobulbaceae bacterium]
MGLISIVDTFDRKVSKSLESFFNKSWLITYVRLVSFSASGIFCFPAYGAILIIANQHAPMVSALIVGECIQLPIIIVLRNLIKRPRPNAVEKDTYYSEWNKYSFPSLHTSRAFMIGLTASSFSSWSLPFLLTAALVIAVSRIVLQKHYLSDIICGAIIGIFSSEVALSFFPHGFSSFILL